MVDNDYGLKANVRPEAPTVRAPSPAMEWASDAVAEMLRALEVPFIALNPGASYRGLHDSLVNHLGNERPRDASSACTRSTRSPSRTATRR